MLNNFFTICFRAKNCIDILLEVNHIWPLTYISRSNQSNTAYYRLTMTVTSNTCQHFFKSHLFRNYSTQSLSYTYVSGVKIYLKFFSETTKPRKLIFCRDDAVLTGYRRSSPRNSKMCYIWPLTLISRSNRGRFVDFGLEISVIQWV
jgi:hypothetical protein